MTSRARARVAGRARHSKYAWSFPAVFFWIFAVVIFALTPAVAGETITYRYDSLGRLIKVVHSGTVNSSTNSCYLYDQADNRTNVTVSTTADCGGTGTGVSFSIANPPSVTEGGSLSFTVTKSGTASGTVTVDYSTANGTALAGSDYTSTSGTLTFLTTDQSKTIAVQTADDATRENAETVNVNIFNSSGDATVSSGQAVGTINDNDDCTGVSFTIANSGAVTEGANSVFTITKAGSTSASCSVDYATGAGTGTFLATSPEDFVAASGTLTFTSAQNSKTVSVTTVNDTSGESTETFSMALSNATNGAVLASPSSATATINDDDTCAGISFTVASNGGVTEGAGSIFTVTKSGSTAWSCTVDYATANGTATAPGDYTAASGTLTFASGTASKTVTVTTNDDSTVETAETLKLNLSNATGGALLGTPHTATATINDNDSGGVCSGVRFSVNDPPTVTEGDPLTFTVTKAGSTSSSCSITYATANGTAIAGTNYVAKSGTLTFTATQSTQGVTITTIDTGRAKGIRNMFLNLSTASGGGSISDSQGIGSIDHSGEICITCTQVVDPGAGGTATESTTSSPDPNTTSDPPPTGE